MTWSLLWHTLHRKVQENKTEIIQHVIVILLGLILGVTFSCLYETYLKNSSVENISELSVYDNYDTFGELRYDPELVSSYASELLRGLEEVTARRLAREVRVICLILTSANNHKSRAFHVKTTWGRHCNHLLFISDKIDTELPSLDFLSVGGGAWNTTATMLKHVHDQYKLEYDWLLVAHDDTYVIVENLRNIMNNMKLWSPDDPLYYGLDFKSQKEEIMRGDTGYILSRETVERLVTQAFDGKHKDCPQQGDKYIHLEHQMNDIRVCLDKCLRAVKTTRGESVDDFGHMRSYCFDNDAKVDCQSEFADWWTWDYLYWPVKQGLTGCSEEPISFHQVSPVKMYMLEYLVYHVSAFSVMHLSQQEETSFF